jgi:hypothetical protein
VKYSAKTKLFLYFLTGAIIVLLIFIAYYQQKKTAETLQLGKQIQVLITSVYCTDSKRTKSSLFFRTVEGEVNHVNLKYEDCKLYKAGDTISVYKNTDKTWYEIDRTSLDMADTEP